MAETKTRSNIIARRMFVIIGFALALLVLVALQASEEAEATTYCSPSPAAAPPGTWIDVETDVVIPGGDMFIDFYWDTNFNGILDGPDIPVYTEYVIDDALFDNELAMPLTINYSWNPLLSLPPLPPDCHVLIQCFDLTMGPPASEGIIIFDSIPPTEVMMDVTGTYWWETSNDLVVYGPDHTLTLSSSDPFPGSGIDHYEYQIDGGGWISTPGTFQVTGTGWHDVEYVSVDAAGWTSPINTTRVYVSNTYMTGVQSAGTYNDQYLFACNVTVTGTVTLQNTTIIMNSTVADTQYFDVSGPSGHLVMNDWDSDPSTIYDEAKITNIDSSHYYYMRVNSGGALTIDYSTIEYCGYLDTTGPEPATFADLGVWVNDGTASLTCPRFYSPQGIGIIFEGSSGTYTLDGQDETSYYGLFDSIIGFALIDADNVQILDTHIENNYMFGGYANDSIGLVQGNNFTANGLFITQPDGFGGGVYVNGSNMDISDNTFYMNEGPGAAIVGDASVYDCTFYDNAQSSGNSPEMMVVKGYDMDNPIYVDVYRNNITNTMGRVGLQVEGAVGLNAHNNTFNTPISTAIGVGMQTDSAPIVNIPYHYIRDNNITADVGIHWGCYKNNVSNATTISIGDVYITSNILDTASWAINIVLYMEGSDGLTLGNFYVDGNNMTGYGGIVRGMYMMYQPQLGSDVSLGHTSVSNNFFDNTQYGIVMPGMMVMDTNGGVINWGDTQVSGNTGTITVGSFFDSTGNQFFNITDTTIAMGDWAFDNNNVTTVDNGIWYDGMWAMELYGTTSITIGDTSYTNNILDAPNNGIRSDYMSMGMLMFDYSSLEIGDTIYDSNRINSGMDGIMLVGTSNLFDMHNYSQGSFGDFIFTQNTITSTNSRGIGFDHMMVGSQMYDLSSGSIGDVVFQDNNLTTWDSGIMYMPMNLGFDNYNSSAFQLGDIDCINNTIDASSGGIGTGIMVQEMSIGSFLYGASSTQVGHATFEQNTILGETGLYFGLMDCGSNVLGSSIASFQDITIDNNDVNASMWAVECDVFNFGMNIDGDSRATLGNKSIQGNNIESTGDAGLYYFQFIFGQTLSNDAYVSAGWTDISYNNITSNNAGMLLDVNTVGNMMSDNSQTHIGYFHITHNNISSANDLGIFFPNFYSLGYQMEGNTIFSMGDMLINDNTINSPNNPGIHLDQWYMMGSEMNNYATATFGNIEVNRNTITSMSSGISTGTWNNWGSYLSYDWGSWTPTAGACHVTRGHVQFNDNILTVSSGDGIFISSLDTIGFDVWGESTFTMGNLEVLRNDVNSTNEGIFIGGIMSWGHVIHGRSQVTFGDVLVNQNIINTTSSFGISFPSVGYIAYDMWEDSQATVGKMEINNNTIHQSANGIWAWHEYWGGTMNENSIAVFGDICIDDNVVNSTGAGIQLDHYRIGSDNMDNAQVTFGDFSTARNTVNTTADALLITLYQMGNNLNNYARTVLGEFHIDNNIIDSQSSGIVYGFYENGDALFNYANVTMGGLYLSGNTIDAALDGVLCSGLFNIGNNLNQYSTVAWDGFYQNHNTVNAGWNGIHMGNMYSIGYFLNQNSMATIGNIETSDNTVIAQSGYGIYYNMWDIGSSVYGYSSFTMGDWLLNNNTINSTDAGIYLNPSQFAYDLQFGASSTIGSCEMNYNTINSTFGNGIECKWLSQFGSSIQESSSAKIGSVQIMHNNIISDLVGLYLDPSSTGAGVYDNAQATFGDYLVSHNSIESISDQGIYFYFNTMGANLFPSSLSSSMASVTVGDIIVEHNHINATFLGINYQNEYFAYDLWDNSEVTIGDVRIDGNIIEADDGIYLVRQYIGSSLNENSQATIGALHIVDNDINASSSGMNAISLNQQYFAYPVNNNAQMSCGDVYMHGNTIRNSFDGVMIGYTDNGDLQDNAHGAIPGIIAYDNEVNSSNTGLSISIYTSPWSVGPSAILDEGVIDIADSNFTSQFGVQLFSDITSSQPSLWVHDCNFTDPDGGPGGQGFYGQDTYLSAVIENTTFTDYEDGIVAVNAQLRFGSCTLSGVTGWDIYMNNAANVFMVDSPFNNANVQFFDGASTLDVGWYLTVTVETTTAARISGADLVATSNGTLITENGVTDTNGETILMLREGRYDQANPPTGAPVINYNDHNISATAAGLTGYATPEVTMDMSKAITIVILDNVAPSVGGNSSDINGTTGDPFTFRTTATDNIGMDLIRVHYRFGTGGWNTTDMLVPGALWEHDLILPNNFTGNMEFYFVAHDVSGNIDTSATFSASIIDNDAPTGVTDNSLAEATTGESFEFNVAGMDNIGITYASVTYWFGTGMPTTQVMSGTTGHNHTITLPTNSTDTLYYKFTVRDSGMLTFTSGDFSRTMADNDDPTIISDNSASSGTTGDMLDIEVNATDNVGIDVVEVEYWYGTGAHSTVTLGGTGPYTISLAVADDASDVLHYVITVSDIAGNSADITGNADISDDDSPAINMDSSSPVAIAGETYSVEVDATDNLGIVSAQIEYWFGSGSHTIMDLTGTGPYDYDLLVASTTTDTLYYRVIFEDAEGNSLIGPSMDISMVSDNSDTAVGTGQQAHFEFNGNDVVENMNILYWFGNQTGVNVTLDGDWPRSFDLMVPIENTLPLSYQIIVYDGSQWIVSSDKVISVEDTTEPFNIMDASSNTAVEEGSFTFQADAEDNIGVATIVVEYWFNNGTHIRENLTSGELTIDIPEGSEGELNYVYHVTDDAGNTYTTEEQQVDVDEPTSSIAATPAESDDEGSLFPWIIVIVLILIIVLLLVDKMRGAGKPEGAPVDEDIPEEDVEPPVDDAPVEEEVVDGSSEESMDIEDDILE